MEVNSHFEESLRRNLKLQDPWLSSKPWESIASESGGLISDLSDQCSAHDRLYDLSSVSEASVVRLVMNALQGIQSAIVSIEQLSALFLADPADRSIHRMRTLWNRSVSTCALGRMLRSIGFSGSLVILLYKFVDFFTCSSFDKSLLEKWQAEQGEADELDNVHKNVEHPPNSLVNQAFAVAIRQILEGYLSALDTLDASVDVRRSLNNVHLLSSSSQLQGSLRGVAHSEVTLLEVYLHTKELRVQLEGLGHLCHLYDVALGFSSTSFEDLTAKTNMLFLDFPRGGNLLTYLYTQLQIVDPAHCSLLKHLFQRALEPYSGFIKSWIYEAKIDDPYGEFMVEYGVDPPSCSHGIDGTPIDFPLATMREQDGAPVPCFLKNVSVPLLRAGQQLQVIMKLLRFCNYVHAGDYRFEDILPCSSNFISNKDYCAPLSFNKGEIEEAVLARRNFYSKMHEKLENIMETLDIKYRQVVLHDAASVYASNDRSSDVQDPSTLEETLTFPTKEEDSNKALQNSDSEASSMDEDLPLAFDPLESSDCSSSDDVEEQVDSAKSLKSHENFSCSKQGYLSALCFSSLSSDKGLVQSSQIEKKSSVRDDLSDFHDGDHTSRKYNDSWKGPAELSRSCIPEIPCAGPVADLGWLAGGFLQNTLSKCQKYRDHRSVWVTGSENDTNTSGGQILAEITSCSSDWSTVPDVLKCKESDLHRNSSSNSFLIQSWNAKYPLDVLSMNPMFTKNAFLHDVKNHEKYKSKLSKTFPYFDFSSTTDPSKVYEGRLLAEQMDNIQPELSSFVGTSVVRHVDSCERTQYNASAVPLNKSHVGDGGTSMKNCSIETHLKDACGGSSWQSLVHGFRSTHHASFKEGEHAADTVFLIPLDIIIDKCLQQEILLQYAYISRLSIKLLDGGFDLQEHFLALRRYHFMEIADWADLFITSLWHHKWHVKEAVQKVPEIQGLLESSIQRSSCESDLNKDRLYIYVKDQERVPFSAAAVGVHSFSFIGLGYRVDWPVNIVLTPSALKIYADIFTFLIQVKLAVLSLSDVWCFLKGYRHVSTQKHEQHQRAISNFNCLVKLRQQINHFVSTLQQYVLSQLSHVSWCRFCYARKHEVKDMMDLESVHMAYLRDSMHICFLDDETRSISKNIESILQCAIDFRSSLVKEISVMGSDNQVPVGISQIKISQVLSLKDKFYKNLKELHLIYCISPKHGEFGFSRFWSQLDYNECYSNTFSNEMFHYNLLVQ